MKLLAHEWSEDFADLFDRASEGVILCAPYITMYGADCIARIVRAARRSSVVSHIVTDLSPRAMSQGATDPAAVRAISRTLSNAPISHLPRLHAKVYIADEKAIVTSGNLTVGGLRANHEYGVMVDDKAIVRALRSDVLAYASLGARITDAAMACLCDTVQELRESFRRQMEEAAARTESDFELLLNRAEDEILRARLSGGSMHGIFARTIEYLLRKHGPLSTQELHARIASIHPDLCDDTIDRVINGVRFGKKWKHAVRTSQQMLKKQGRAVLRENRWRLNLRDEQHA